MAIQKELLERVIESPRLPSIPAVALKIIDLVQQDEVDMDAIAETIRHDPALSTKVLKTVNSSFYGQAKTISTINQALVVLGLNSVKTLALGFSLVGNLSESGTKGFDHVTLWKRSLFSATAAKCICDLAAIVQAEEVFMASLLQDVGMLALSQTVGSQYAHLLAQAGDDHRALAALEQAALSGDHAEVGGALAEQWGLPPVLALPIRYHESVDEAPENVQPLARAVVAGGSVADLMMDPDSEAKTSRCYERLLHWFSLEAEQAKAFLADVHKQAGVVQRLLDLPAGELGNADDILTRANEALERISLNATKKADALERDNEQLKEEVNTDSLTGIANRRKFDADAAAAFEAAHAQRPLTVMFLDIDHFKQFNDVHGHATGDEVLKLFAKTLAEVGDTVGEPYRLGGEEFAMLFPGVDQKAAALIAERLREGIDSAVCVKGEDGEMHNVTTSIGVATYEGVFFKRIEQVVKAADRGVYAAKHAGRNCVRVFVPKPPTQSEAA